MKKYICHCDLRANDGVSHITAKPTVYSEGVDRKEAYNNAVEELKDKYRKLGCVWVDVNIALMREI